MAVTPRVVATVVAALLLCACDTFPNSGLQQMGIGQAPNGAITIAAYLCPDETLSNVEIYRLSEDGSRREALVWSDTAPGPSGFSTRELAREELLRETRSNGSRGADYVLVGKSSNGGQLGGVTFAASQLPRGEFAVVSFRFDGRSTVPEADFRSVNESDCSTR